MDWYMDDENRGVKEKGFGLNNLETRVSVN
jgi:hypothetical protein